jgi:DNA polymerase-3 subunit beta
VEFNILRAEDWITALLRINRAADSERASGLNSYVRLRSAGEGVEMLARDGAVAAKTEIAGPCCATEGGCCVPMQLLKVVLEGAPDMCLKVTLDNNILSFAAPGWKRGITTRDHEEFQHFPKEPERFHSVPFGALRALLNCTTHAADQDDVQHPNRACVTLRRGAGVLDAFSTDSHRSAHARVAYDGDIPDRIVIHQRALREIHAAMSTDKPDVVELGQSGNHVFFKTALTVIAVLTPPYTPIDMSAMFGCSYPTSCLVNRSKLVTALNSASLTTRRPEVGLKFTKDGIKISAESPEGSSDDEICGVRNGPDVDVSLNGKYFVEAARAINTEEVMLSVGGPSGPLSVRAGENDDAEVVICVMAP